MRQFGPNPKKRGECHACHKPFMNGDYTTLIPLGPGDNEEERAKARLGRHYNAVAVEVHWECAGEPE